MVSLHPKLLRHRPLMKVYLLLHAEVKHFPVFELMMDSLTEYGGPQAVKAFALQVMG